VKQAGKCMNSALEMKTINEQYTDNQNHRSYLPDQTVSSYSEADAFCSHKIILTECNNRVCWDQKYMRQIIKI
jgi:glucose-6-phosphate 1-dehydrogenase